MSGRQTRAEWGNVHFPLDSLGVVGRSYGSVYRFQRVYLIVTKMLGHISKLTISCKGATGSDFH